MSSFIFNISQADIYCAYQTIKNTIIVGGWRGNPLTAGAEYIRVFISISTLSTTFYHF